MNGSNDNSKDLLNEDNLHAFPSSVSQMSQANYERRAQSNATNPQASDQIRGDMIRQDKKKDDQSEESQAEISKEFLPNNLSSRTTELEGKEAEGSGPIKSVVETTESRSGDTELKNVDSDNGFTSFPTLPDPQQDQAKSLGNIFSKTLRKVTNNASSFVHNYTINRNINDITSDSQNGRALTLPVLSTKPVEVSPVLDTRASTFASENGLADINTEEKSTEQATEYGSINQASGFEDNKTINTREDSVPKVYSDHKGIKISTSTIAKPQPTSLNTSATNSVINVHALASSDKDAPNAAEPRLSRLSPPISEHKVNLKRSVSPEISGGHTAKVFNNLPNDIELSDDSASDSESIMNASRGSFKSTTQAIGDLSKYSESTAKSSPIKANSTRQNERYGDYASSISTFQAIDHDDKILRNKASSNLPSAIFDNAKKVLHSNITVPVVSSASSIKPGRSKKKKKKPEKTSENPLKNGGIPKKYWMNDNFVSDCLNCFKPFTAFRRKHHCRFCGQIFCSECTLFISYRQHKELRNGHTESESAYSDKLRVCRPCYSDVIIYLSDESTSSDSDLEIDDDNTSRIGDESFSSLNQLSRMKTWSTYSRRPSIAVESSGVGSNRSVNDEEMVTPTSAQPSSSNRYLLATSSPQSDLPSSKTSSNKLNSESRANSKQAPSMAIPTRRSGEAVEIPLSKYAQSNSFYRDHNSAIPFHSSLTNDSTFPWLSHYSPMRTANSVSESPLSSSFDNVYNNVIGKTIGKYRIPSGTDKNLTRQRSKRSDFFQPNNEQIDGFSINNVEAESENEDEQVMSLYTSLNHYGYDDAGHRPPITAGQPPTSSIVVPTLGDFPTMFSHDRTFPKVGTSTASSTPFPMLLHNNNKKVAEDNGKGDPPKNSNIAFLDDAPTERIRSQERAHASLLRMRSRRKTKSSRKISIRSQNNYTLPGFDISTINTTSSPSPTPTSPTPQTFPTPESGSSNLGVKKIPSSSLMTGPHRVIKQSSEAEETNDFNASDNDTLDDTQQLESMNIDRVINSNSELNLFSFLTEKTKAQKGDFADYLNSVLIQCLEDCDVKKDQGKWLSALTRVISFVDQVKITDTLDIKQYIKIKKILGDTIEQTEIIDGLFMTKDVDSRRMPVSITEPKIALLMFPIEYLKQKESFISLRIINSQQNVYITNLVSRLISLEPDIVVVGDSVCGIALKLLEDANITVISNTKPQVIERISRYTRADIFQSINDLFFKKGSLGVCSKFEVRHYVYRGIVKTFSFFTGTDMSTGFTISLRGGDEDLLNSIKYAVETMILGQMNSKFELSMYKDSHLTFKYDNSNPEALALKQRIAKLDDNSEENEENSEVHLDVNEVVRYVDSFVERKISLSPAVMFPLPAPLMKLVEAFEKFKTFKESRDEIEALTPDTDNEKISAWLDPLKIDINPSCLPRPNADLVNIVKYVSNSKLNSLQNEYFARARAWSNCMKLTTYQLYPVFHRSINLLYSTISMKHATPCLGPNIIAIDYYSDNDKCVGLFLDQIFKDSTKNCEECGDLLSNHYKSYAHGEGKLDFILEQYDNVVHSHESKDRRVMWGYCKECNQSTPIVPFTDDSYYLSVGKFFELSFWGQHATVDLKSCPHNYFKSYVRCFGYMNLVIRVEYSDIDTYEVVVPKKQVEFLPDIDVKLKADTWNHVKSKSSSFFQSISKRLNRVKVDTFDRADDGLRKIEELKSKLARQVENVGKKTDELFYSTPISDRVSLNSILRELQRLGVEWDSEFNEFEENFLPNENEITKITQFHLKNFLLDKYGNENGPMKDGESGNKITEKNTGGNKQEQNGDQGSYKPSESEKPKDSSADTENPTRGKESKDVSNQPARVAATHNSNLLDRINKMEQLLNEERNGFSKDDLKKTTKQKPVLSQKGNEQQSGSSSKVSQLASFFNQMNFDQISMEFRKQRELEMRKKLNRFKAIPIVESRPIVEIYDKIEDVVDVNDGGRIPSGSKGIENFDASQSKRDFPAPAGKAGDREKEKEKEKEKEREEERSIESSSKYKNLEIPQPEKQSLLKTLTNFWADRSATLWDPLEYPLDSNEHTFADSDVIVREDEPTSLVAFCLSSSDYKQKVKIMESEGSIDDENIESNNYDDAKFKQFTKIEKKFKKVSNKSTYNVLEKVMSRIKSNHLKYQFVDGNTHLSCKIFYSEHFEAFRRSCGNDESFIQSLSRCIKWNSSGGKSGSSFLKTLDDRYIVKELSKSELESFVSIAPFYFKYISQSMFNTLTTAIAKIFGFYQIEIKNSVNGKTFKMDFLIMENLFYGQKTTRIFDLKGSMRNRHVKQTGKENEVLLDENMIEYIYESPLFVKEHSKRLLRGSLFNDTSFLSAMDVMDYSLVIGIDDTSKRLYIGIIDWLRTFTWDKKVENWVKGNNLIGRKGIDPTIVTPKQYRIRFREAMERYVLEVPDIWYEGK